jgi:hypothetical protein
VNILIQLIQFRLAGLGEAEYRALASNPGLADFSDREFAILPEPTRVTAPAMVSTT